MSIPESLLVSLNGFGIVFLVLVTLIIFLKIMAFAVSIIEKAQSKGGVASVETPQESRAVPTEVQMATASAGSLKLLNVDERTAAMIMAIVSDESKIPLAELNFLSIKALD